MNAFNLGAAVVAFGVGLLFIAEYNRNGKARDWLTALLLFFLAGLNTWTAFW